MKLKASLHIHTKEDLSDGRVISYDVFKLIDEAHKFRFQVLALTCHKSLATQPQFIKYARERGILLIPGIELELEEGSRRPHVVVLNGDTEVLRVKNLVDLKKYKSKHPETFILAAHPHAGGHWSLGLDLLTKYIQVFDAVEHTWFYSAWFNSNKAVIALAKKFNKLIIATGDIHTLKYLNSDYTFIEANSLNLKDVLSALKAGRVTNVTKTKSLIEMFLFLLKFLVWSSVLTFFNFRGRR
jgi:predicted metal-dependent phosphoesterase TrpH